MDIVDSSQMAGTRPLPVYLVGIRAGLVNSWQRFTVLRLRFVTKGLFTRGIYGHASCILRRGIYNLPRINPMNYREARRQHLEQLAIGDEGVDHLERLYRIAVSEVRDVVCPGRAEMIEAIINHEEWLSQQSLPQNRPQP